MCFGEATKFSADLLDADKTYEAEIRLGVTTDSGDAEGQIIATAPAAVTAADVARVLPAFMGDILQVPPMHSALKRDGKPLYELARQGIVVERAARPVTVHAIDVLACSEDFLRLSVHCSKGTYIRVLAADIGAALGCGGHLVALRRTRVGPLDLAAAVTLEALNASGEDERARFLLPLDALLQNLPRVDLALTTPSVSGMAIPSICRPGCMEKSGSMQTGNCWALASQARGGACGRKDCCNCRADLLYSRAFPCWGLQQALALSNRGGVVFRKRVLKWQ